jgi:ABC-2 type transport system ATP-binding protein
MKDTTQPESVITVKHLHKEFLLPHQRRTSLKQAFVNIGHRNYKTRQRVLDGIDFDVKKGEFFGIVGRNGSGKSTLLKILAGVYRPSAGSVDINGELTPFIELGVGFNPELSGRDNIFLNGALLGFSRKEMAAMYDEIVAFAELEQFMDQKLKNYSSGMQVRLAFSIAIKAHNDILIFDEVLAVGDEAFQRKCLDVFEQYKANKQTVILVTHDMETVRQFCTRAMLIDKGKITEIGDPKKVAGKYSKLNQQVIDAASTDKNEHKSSARLRLSTYNTDDKKRVSFLAGETIRAELRWKQIPDLAHVVINIYKQSGEHITGFRYSPKDHTREHVWVDMRPNIKPGKYYFVLQAISTKNRPLEEEQRSVEFSITDEYVPTLQDWSGLVYVDRTWDEKRDS